MVHNITFHNKTNQSSGKMTVKESEGNLYPMLEYAQKCDKVKLINTILTLPPLYTGFIHFFVRQNQRLFKDFPGQKLQFSSTFFWAFSYIKPCLTFPFFKWKCLYPVRKMMDVQCQWFCGWRYFCVCLLFLFYFSVQFCFHIYCSNIWNMYDFILFPFFF